MKSKIILIGGASRSGKSSLAQNIQSNLANSHCIIIHQDDYVNDENTFFHVGDDLDWEHPNTLDDNRFINEVRKSINKYDFIIVEGFQAYNQSALVEYADLKIFLIINKDDFVSRKLKDDRWNTTTEAYAEHAWQSFLKYGRTNLDMVDIIFDAALPFEEQKGWAELMIILSENHS